MAGKQSYLIKFSDGFPDWFPDKIWVKVSLNMGDVANMIKIWVKISLNVVDAVKMIKNL